jgi:hypothetical protein
MANKDAPHGLNAVRMMNGGKIPMHKYTVAATTAVYQGDVVTLRATGLIATLKTAAGATNIVGVASNYAAASGDVWVYDDPYTIFEVQSDGATDPGATTAGAFLGENIDLVVTAGNTTTKISKHELDYSALTTATADPLRIIGYYESVDNDKLLAHARFLVLLNKHFYKASGVRARI